MDTFHRHERHEQILTCLPAHPATKLATLSAADDWDLYGQRWDRLSALPDDLRRNIVSRLPIKDAVRTTALARGWRHTWRSTPLNFYDAHLLPARGNVRAGIIDHVLKAHPGPFSVVYLENCFTRRRELADWCRLLAASQVKDLVLVSLHPPEAMGRGPSIRLPADILRCANLRRLYLGFWKFPDNSDLHDGACVFPHLEELAILDIRMEGGDLDHMLTCSPKLNKLALAGEESPNHVRLRGENLRCVLFWLSAKVRLISVDARSLERLIMWRAPHTFGMEINFASPTGLNVLGYFELGADKLRIGETVIEVRTRVSPISMIPSVKILALKVDLSVITKVQMMARFLRCFPNIETLHVECDGPNKPSGNNNAEFYQNLNPIECVQSQIKKVVLHKFTGHQSEMALLRYLSQNANRMQQLTLVSLHLPDEISLGEIKGQLADLVIPPLVSEACTLLFLGPAKKLAWTFHRASDLSIHDPFLLDDGLELYRFVK